MTSLSIVVPVYKSRDCLNELHARLTRVAARLAVPYEILFVEDGGGDGSWEIIRQAAAKDPHVKGIRLNRNFGQHHAVLCGIRAAQYEVTATLDDDLQHPPEEIEKLLAKLAEGFDLVYGVPRRPSHSLVRNLLSGCTKSAMSKAIGLETIRHIGAFRAFRTGLRAAFADYKGPYVLIDVLLSWGTARFGYVEVDHAPRSKGRSNYNFAKLVNQAMLILTGYSVMPLRLASFVGFGFTLFGIVILLFVLGSYFFENTVPGFPFLASVICIFSGAQLFTLGIIGEYLSHIFHRSMGRPIYLVAEREGFDREPEKRPAKPSLAGASGG